MGRGHQRSLPLEVVPSRKPLADVLGNIQYEQRGQGTTPTMSVSQSQYNRSATMNSASNHQRCEPARVVRLIQTPIRAMIQGARQYHHVPDENGSSSVSIAVML